MYLQCIFHTANVRQYQNIYVGKTLNRKYFDISNIRHGLHTFLADESISGTNWKCPIIGDLRNIIKIRAYLIDMYNIK